MNDQLVEWLATRPECVQRLAEEFPPNMRIIVGEDVFHVIGWTEGDSVIVSTVDPSVDYDDALAKKKYLCAEHLRT